MLIRYFYVIDAVLPVISWALFVFLWTIVGLAIAVMGSALIQTLQPAHL